MDTLLVNTRMIDPRSAYHGQTADILIREGRIASIAEAHSLDHSGCEVLEEENQCVSPGWIDMRVHVPDPGLEHRESVGSALEMAAQSGFTAVAFCPDTVPPADQKSILGYWESESHVHLTRILPLAAMSKQLAGKELAELFDLYRSGALMFGDANRPIDRPGMLLKAMMYSQLFEGMINLVPAEGDLPEGQMHEGAVNVRLGLSGNPTLRETMAVERIIALLNYAGGRVHLSLVSSKEAVALLREARQRGLPITADTSAHHLTFCDEDLKGYPTALKLQPPLRDRNDRQALIEAVEAGIIDVVVSDHTPLEPEAKACEFNLAQPGALGIQTLFAQTLSALKGDLSLTIEALAIRPRKVLRLADDILATQTEANLTVFSPSAQWTLTRENNCSRSYNTPMLGRPLCGKALAAIAGGKMIRNKTH